MNYRVFRVESLRRDPELGSLWKTRVSIGWEMGIFVNDSQAIHFFELGGLDRTLAVVVE